MASFIGWLMGPDGKRGDTWNPAIGCSKKSPGCDDCYAIIEAHIHAGHPNPKISAAFAGVTVRTEHGLDWTGKVNLLHDRLDKPLHWRRPRYVFVNSLSDLFHRGVPEDFIAEIFAVMLVAEQHVFIALTKEHARMRAVLRNPGFVDKVFQIAVDKYGLDPDHGRARWWPVPNLILGVSVEDQHWADIRVPYLLDAPAAYRALSVEPLLGPLDLTQWLDNSGPDTDCDVCGEERFADEIGVGHDRFIYNEDRSEEIGEEWCKGPSDGARPRRLDLVIVGGESGKGARAMDEAWIRHIVTQCRPNGVKVFTKQLGSHLARKYGLASKKGENLSEWPEHLTDIAVQEMPIQPVMR